MTKYREKPVFIEAEQFFFGKKPWPEGVEEDQIGTVLGCDKNVMRIKVSERCNAYVYDGDWIIRDAEGKRCLPLKPYIFEQIYEEVRDEMPGM